MAYKKTELSNTVGITQSSKVKVTVTEQVHEKDKCYIINVVLSMHLVQDLFYKWRNGDSHIFKNTELLIAKPAPVLLTVSPSLFPPDYLYSLSSMNSKTFKKYFEGHHRVTKVLFCQAH